MKLRQIALASALGSTALLASAQTVTLYGSLDQYVNHMSSSSGSSFTAVNDGSTLRSRLGFRGEEDLGGGSKIKFTLESGIAANSGAAADTTRAFDRQAWVGYSSSVGDFRIGRQNTAIFYRGDYIDFTSRTIGSVVNLFGTPSRYDNDLSYISPRVEGVMVEAHYSLAGTTAGFSNQAIYQTSIDYLNGPFRVGYAGIGGKSPVGAAVSQGMKYDNFYLNYDYGNGKIYAVYIHSNNNTASGALFNGGSILGNVGGVVAGTNVEAPRFYRIEQLSADYKVLPQLRVGALYGRIEDTSGHGKNANGFALGGYYDLSKRTTLLAMWDSIRNDPNAGFRQGASAGLQTNFTSANDVNGRTINGLQLGVVHRF